MVLEGELKDRTGLTAKAALLGIVYVLPQDILCNTIYATSLLEGKYQIVQVRGISPSFYTTFDSGMRERLPLTESRDDILEN